MRIFPVYAKMVKVLLYQLFALKERFLDENQLQKVMGYAS